MEQGKELEIKASTAPAKSELSIEDVVAQTQKIQKLMKQIMKEDEHFGKIPGINSKKNSLFKAGAEKLCFIFRLIPSFEVLRKEFPGDHREYEIKCTLTNQATGEFAGQGVGICSTMETKYRYRDDSKVDVLGDVPKSYWDLRNGPNPGLAIDMIGKGNSTKKIDGIWRVVKVTKSGKKENSDIADTYNTVLKMAKKRAHVDATITACAASDIFTQDLEDLKSNDESTIKNVTPVNKDRTVDLTTAVSSPDPKATDKCKKVYSNIMSLINKKDGDGKDLFPVNEKIENKKKADSVSADETAIEDLYKALYVSAEERGLKE